MSGDITDDIAARAARIGAQLARCPIAADVTVDRLGRDAAALLRSALAARDALTVKNRRGFRKHVAHIGYVAAFYSATVVANADLEGMVAGLQFPDGAHTCGHRDWFFLA